MTEKTEKAEKVEQTERPVKDPYPAADERPYEKAAKKK